MSGAIYRTATLVPPCGAYFDFCTPYTESTTRMRPSVYSLPRWGPPTVKELNALRKAGHTFSQPDLIIAATALHHGLTVVSRDVSDYQKARTPVLNPWVDPLPAGTT
jgi:hypothetical protein